MSALRKTPRKPGIVDVLSRVVRPSCRVSLDIQQPSLGVGGPLRRLAASVRFLVCRVFSRVPVVAGFSSPSGPSSPNLRAPPPPNPETLGVAGTAPGVCSAVAPPLAPAVSPRVLGGAVSGRPCVFLPAPPAKTHDPSTPERPGRAKGSGLKAGGEKGPGSKTAESWRGRHFRGARVLAPRFLNPPPSAAKPAGGPLQKGGGCG